MCADSSRWGVSPQSDRDQWLQAACTHITCLSSGKWQLHQRGKHIVPHLTYFLAYRWRLENWMSWTTSISRWEQDQAWVKIVQKTPARAQCKCWWLSSGLLQLLASQLREVKRSAAQLSSALSQSQVRAATSLFQDVSSWQAGMLVKIVTNTWSQSSTIVYNADGIQL